ncbi:MFS transporter [Thermogymnomonas acidicola]|uniref:MFS transporter n=1 Tax=Thermogymnomonas acidicola TaxID=399579 RepID=A0AA37BSH8_9ARCH|nr:MFS transporter [Thermogymnomonas acidicola]GGM78507.1 MFS transporter [Thermogymnomonas acidicola]
MLSSVAQADTNLDRLVKRRWVRVVAALFAMVFVSVYEYSWTLYTPGIAKAFHYSTPNAAVIGGIFSVYVVVQAISMWLFGRYSDRHGPRMISILGGLITGIGYIGSAFAPSIPVLYLTYGFGSIGVGIIYATSISSALRWYTGKKRGMMVGLIDLGFGGGSFALSPLIKYIISVTSNFRDGFLYLGIAQIIIIPVMGYFFIYPPAGFRSPDEPAAEKVRKRVPKGPGDFTVGQMTRTWQWAVIYVSFFLIVGEGLAVISHLIPIGEAKGFTFAAVLAVFLFPFANGFGRFISGTVSDYLGRPLSMMVFFFISGFAMLGAALIPGAPYGALYIVLIMLAAFGWGPLFALFPPTVGDYFGTRNSGANYGFTYTAKALGGIFAGYVFSLILLRYPGTHPFVDLIPLTIASIMAFCAGILGVILRPPKRVPLTRPAAATVQTNQGVK